MQTDVLSAHLNSTGFAVLGRVRVKGVTYTAAVTAGTLHLYDTATTPVTTGTYGQSTTTITVTSTAHGLVVGKTIGITFATATGVSATNGNYKIATVADANTFTVTDINSRTITAGTACTYTTGRWLMSFDTATVTVSTTGLAQNQSILIPGEGMLANTGVYALMTNQAAVTIFYG
mgnify:CR=1 FL=1|tara:strand:+ start:631 stop:1158 length:528 start_codon:yes stop_codon:yes gene_type:complete